MSNLDIYGGGVELTLEDGGAVVRGAHDEDRQTDQMATLTRSVSFTRGQQE
jgi:hypothetical protein